jgi:hypothetical protein
MALGYSMARSKRYYLCNPEIDRQNNNLKGRDAFAQLTCCLAKHCTRMLPTAAANLNVRLSADVATIGPTY